MIGPRKIARTFRSWVVLLWASLCLVSSAVADSALNDAAKLRKIEAMAEDYRKEFPSVRHISAREALILVKSSQVIFIDHRTESEQALSMLPQAVLSKDLLKNPKAYADRTLIVYCTIGYRSGNLARKLRKKGVSALNLRGGILAWIHAGGKVYQDGRPVKRVHVYGKKWDLAPSAYEAVR
jgi:sodium/bile acid cotransporter 7